MYATSVSDHHDDGDTNAESCPITLSLKIGRLAKLRSGQQALRLTTVVTVTPYR